MSSKCPELTRAFTNYCANISTKWLQDAKKVCTIVVDKIQMECQKQVLQDTQRGRPHARPSGSTGHGSRSAETIWMDLTNLCQDVAEWCSVHPIAAGIIVLAFILLIITLLFAIRNRCRQSSKSLGMRSIGIQAFPEAGSEEQSEFVTSNNC